MVIEQFDCSQLPAPPLNTCCLHVSALYVCVKRSKCSCWGHAVQLTAQRSRTHSTRTAQRSAAGD